MQHTLSARSEPVSQDELPRRAAQTLRRPRVCLVLHCEAASGRRLVSRATESSFAAGRRPAQSYGRSTRVPRVFRVQGSRAGRCLGGRIIVPREPLQRVLVEGVKACLTLLRGGRVEVLWGACMNEFAGPRE